MTKTYMVNSLIEKVCPSTDDYSCLIACIADAVP